MGDLSPEERQFVKMLTWCGGAFLVAGTVLLLVLIYNSL